MSHILADTETVWERIFQSGGRPYEPPKLVLYSGATHTGCALGQSIEGPFYCPLDRKVYLDLGFFRELREHFNARGNFPQAYVIAHEIGHHVQNLLGIDRSVQQQVQRALARGDKTSANLLLVRLELQADCLAGVWANRSNRIENRLEPGDIEHGLNAVAELGDDTLQRRAQGKAVPESFTHGTSAQRVHWFRMGLDSGRLNACDTFSSAAP